MISQYNVLLYDHLMSRLPMLSQALNLNSVEHG